MIFIHFFTFHFPFFHFFYIFAQILIPFIINVMRKIIVTLLALLSFAVANAQEEHPTSYWFVNAKGGISTPFESGLKSTVYTAPSASIAIGKMMNPYVGFRANVNKAFTNDEQKHIALSEPASCIDDDITVDLDGMLNLSTLFGKKEYYPVNVYMLAGLHHEHLGGGFMAEYNILRNLSVAAEATLNTHRVLTTQAGLVYKFGGKKKAKPVAVVAPEPEPEPAPVVIACPGCNDAYGNGNCPESEYGKCKHNSACSHAASCKCKQDKPEPPKPQPVVQPEPLKETMFYEIRLSEPTAESTLNKIAAWCNKYPAKNITISGYADRETGNAETNAGYAKARAEKVAAALQEKGVAASRMTVRSYGDTVQPFSENDKNRCVIVVGE